MTTQLPDMLVVFPAIVCEVTDSKQLPGLIAVQGERRNVSCIGNSGTRQVMYYLSGKTIPYETYLETYNNLKAIAGKRLYKTSDSAYFYDLSNGAIVLQAASIATVLRLGTPANASFQLTGGAVVISLSLVDFSVEP